MYFASGIDLIIVSRINGDVEDSFLCVSTDDVKQIYLLLILNDITQLNFRIGFLWQNFKRR